MSQSLYTADSLLRSVQVTLRLNQPGHLIVLIKLAVIDGRRLLDRAFFYLEGVDALLISLCLVLLEV